MRRILTIVAVPLLAAGVVMGAAGPARAATCYGYSCHGHDPTAYGCLTDSLTGPVYVQRGTTVYATLYNRYSKGCNANWATAQLSQASLNAHYVLKVAIDTNDSIGHFELMCYPGPNNTGAEIENCYNYGYGGPYQAYTDMVDGTNITRANVCVWTANFSQEIGCVFVDQ